MDPLTLAYILIAIGVVLLIAELFIPTGGSASSSQWAVFWAASQ